MSVGSRLCLLGMAMVRGLVPIVCRFPKGNAVDSYLDQKGIFVVSRDGKRV